MTKETAEILDLGPRHGGRSFARRMKGFSIGRENWDETINTHFALFSSFFATISLFAYQSSINNIISSSHSYLQSYTHIFRTVLYTCLRTKELSENSFEMELDALRYITLAALLYSVF